MSYCLTVWISATWPLQNSFLVSKIKRSDMMISRILEALTYTSCIGSTSYNFGKVDSSNFLHHYSEYLEASGTKILHYIFLSTIIDTKNWYLCSISDLGRTMYSSINNWLRVIQINTGWNILSIQNSCHPVLFLLYHAALRS